MNYHRIMKNKKKHLALALAGAMFMMMPEAMAADVSLQDAINRALSENTGLKVTQKGEDSAKYKLAKAKVQNGIAPSVTGELNAEKKDSGATDASGKLAATVSVPIYSGGKNQANIKQAKIGVKAADLQTERDRENLKLNVIKAYYNALEAKKTVGVRQETVDKYKEHYNNVNQLYSAGAKARIDVIRSSVELSNAQQNLIKAENNYEVDLATLRNYMNMDRTEPLNLTSDFSYDVFGIDMNDCIDYAYKNRKDLLIDQYKLEQQEQAIKAAKAGYLPSVKVSLGLDQTERYKPSSSSSHGASAGVGLSWNIFDGGLTRAEVKSAKTDYDVARLNLLKDKEDIDLSVRQAYYSMREAEKRFNSTKDAVNQAEQDYYIAREKYRAGEGLMLDIIDAQEALSTARLNQISAQYDYARYKATVENAMGMGLNASERASAAELETDVDTTLLESSVAERAGDTAAALRAAEQKQAVREEEAK